MESLTETIWDVVISGTGLAQSLLALSLSRSDKKILHLDSNDYYGGAEAAFSLLEADAWVKEVNKGDHLHVSEAQLTTPDQPLPSENAPKLGSSRSYTLSLAPQLLYSNSTLLPVLVSSQVHTQLEFLAVGSWWVYRDGRVESSSEPGLGNTRNIEEAPASSLQRIPNGREDVFADKSIAMRQKRGLMKFLRHVMQEPSSEENLVEPLDDATLSHVLSSNFGIPPDMHDPLLALSLSYEAAGSIKWPLALHRIRRHLRSIGVFGAGFGAVIPKYGGAAEIAQVGCRAGAVGGGVYLLGRGASKIQIASGHAQEENGDPAEATELVMTTLRSGELIRSRYVVGGEEVLPRDPDTPSHAFEELHNSTLARSIMIVSSELSHLFPQVSEHGPAPAGAVVFVSGESQSNQESTKNPMGSGGQSAPIYLFVHSADSDECPPGQSVIYASTSAADKSTAERLWHAVDKVIKTSPEGKAPIILWSMYYVTTGRKISLDHPPQFKQDHSGRILAFPPSCLDLAFDDDLVASVKAVWKVVMGPDADENEFMQFEEREGVSYDDDGDT